MEVAEQALLEREIHLTEKVRQVFIDVLVQQEIATVRSEQVQLAREFTKVAKRRFKAGSNSELDVVQAELAHAETLLLQTCCFGDLAASREALAALLGMAATELPELTGPFYQLEKMEDLAVPADYPGLRRLEAKVDRVLAAAQLAKAMDTPDVALGAGYRYEARNNINSFVFSISMPLNLVKKGKAEHAARILQADAIQADYAELRRQLEQELASRLALYNGAKMKVDLSRDSLIPKAKQVYEVSLKGYQKGLFSWLELIAAQQNLAQIRVNYIEFLHDAHLTRNQLDKFVKEGK